MPLIRDARTLSNKAISSLRIAMSTFNSYEDEGRVCSVLLHLQHACEMLLKAVLVQNKVKMFEDKSGKSIGFEKCLRLCRQDHGLTEAEAGVMRMIDALRDAEQHWFAKLEEDTLYLHTRALITVFDAYMRRRSTSTSIRAFRRACCLFPPCRRVISISLSTGNTS